VAHVVQADPRQAGSAGMPLEPVRYQVRVQRPSRCVNTSPEST
jgi:hypothetical protein